MLVPFARFIDDLDFIISFAIKPKTLEVKCRSSILISAPESENILFFVLFIASIIIIRGVVEGICRCTALNDFSKDFSSVYPLVFRK